MHASADLPLDRPLSEPPAAAKRSSRTGPMLGSLPRAKRGLGWWLLPAIDLLASSIALAVVVQRRPAPPLFPALPVAPAAARRRLRPRSASTHSTPARERPRSDRRAGLACDPPPGRRPASPGRPPCSSPSTAARSSRSAAVFVVARHRRPRVQRAAAAAPRPGRALGPGRRRGDRRAPQAYAPLRDYASVVGTVPPPEDGAEPTEPRRRARGRRPLPRRPGRDRHPARR